MSNGLAVFATSLRRGHFLRPSIVLIMYFRRKCEGIFVVVPLNLQLYVLISPIWPADAEIKALETKRLKKLNKQLSWKILFILDNVYKGFRLSFVAVRFIDWDPHWYSLRVKEAIHTRLDPINRDSGIEIPEAWMPTIRQNSSQLLPQQTAEGTVPSSNNANNALDWNPPTMSEVRDTPITNNHGGINK